MGLGDNHAQIVADGLMQTIRCANKDCNEPVFKFHGLGMVELVQACVACGRHTAVTSDFSTGIRVFLLPKRRAPRSNVQPIRDVAGE